MELVAVMDENYGDILYVCINFSKNIFLILICYLLEVNRYSTKEMNKQNFVLDYFVLFYLSCQTNYFFENFSHGL